MFIAKHHHRIRAALRASIVHFGLSVLMAILAGAVIFNLWFPYPYRELAGGLHLFWLLVGVDVICGPLLTAFVYNPAKSKKELILDLSLIALMQIAALGYGLHSISQARPIAVVFESDRLVAVAAAAVDSAELEQAPVEYQSLSWNGPILMGIRDPLDGTEKLQSIEMSLQGVAPRSRPGWWQSYEKSRAQAMLRMKRLEDFQPHLSKDNMAALNKSVKATGLPEEEIFILPLVSEKILDQWVALLDEQANIIGYAPIDGFQ